jgi:capsular exopolysaccharide synthesis family protein
MLETMRLQLQIDLWNVDQRIRQQEILVAKLAEKCNEQLDKSATRSAGATDIMYMQTQLARLDKTLDHIDDRILSVQSEARAPGQIIPLTKAVASPPSIAKQMMVVGMGAAMFSCFPLLLSIAVERMKPRLYHVSQVRRAIPQVLIGEIMEPPVSWVHGVTFRRRLARYRESVHNWCTHLLLSDPFRSCRTLSIASVAGDDGKTFLAVQIAVAMAHMKEGKVLLIDGDMRVGRLHLLFGNEETGIGLADVLSFRNRLGEAVVQNEKEPNLYLLSAGQLDVTPYELLGDGRFREMLDSLELSPSNPSGYSLIIVVVPPVANAAESLIMASSTDSTLLCVRQGETVLAAMEDVYRKLVNTGAAVDGIVVKDIPYYQMAGRDGGFADKLEQIRLSHLLQYAD